jgi:uncharacterized membrane protein
VTRNAGQGYRTMKDWLILLAAIAIVCAIYPPVLGLFLGISAMMTATYVVYKLIGG